MAAEPILTTVYPAVLEGVRTGTYYLRFGCVPNVGVEVDVVPSNMRAAVQYQGLDVGYLPADFDTTLVEKVVGLIIAAQGGKDPFVTVKLIARDV